MINDNLTFREVCQMLADDPESWRRMEIWGEEPICEWLTPLAPSNAVALAYIGRPIRLKLRTIRIGDYDVPEPLTEEPEEGTKIYIAHSSSSHGALDLHWLHTDWCLRLLHRRRLHTTEEAAQLHARAEIEMAGGTFDPEE